MSARHWDSNSSADVRGQTTIDFGIGAGVFLIVVVFVFAFIPTMMEPFEAGPQEETVGADRVANTLVGGLLSESSSPTFLDPTCTAAFFDGSDGDTGCSFDDGASFRTQLGVDDHTDLAVSITGDADGTIDTLCLDSDGFVVESSAAACDTEFDRRIADPPTEDGSVVTARRTVAIGGVRGTLFVRMW